MTAVKTAKTYTLEELKEKAGLALNVPALVEIVKTAPTLTQARDKAYQRVAEETHDLKDAKKLADSTRFLAMLRRDFTEEFGKLILQKEQSGKKTEIKLSKKLFHEIEFKLSSFGNISGVELITREKKAGIQDYNTVERFIRFSPDTYGNRTGPRELGMIFCIEILNALVETANPPEDTRLLNNLIQFFEEKFGLKVRACENCNYFTPNFIPNKGCDSQEKFLPWFGACTYCLKVDEVGTIDYRPLGKPNYSCGLWTPKEVPEKPSSA